MAPHPQRLTITHRAWPLARPLASDYGVDTTVDVILVEISDNDSRGRAECVPVRRFGESAASVIATLESMKGKVAGGLDRDTLQKALPPGAARNALDCAFWDMDAKRAYQTVPEIAGLPAPAPVVTAFTLDSDTPEKMAEQAAANRTRPLLKVVLPSDGNIDGLQAVRQAAPAARLIVDAAERWDLPRLRGLIPALTDLRVEMIFQPLPADADDVLAGWAEPIPLCADESCRTVDDLDRVAGRYQAVTIALDKVGGLTAALALAAEARRRGLRIVVGGGTGTSLNVAPALLVAQGAEVVDLDGPLRLAVDRGSGLKYDGSTIQVADGKLWGGAG